MFSPLNYGLPFSVTATHATAAVASNTGVENKVHWITDIAVSSDKAGAILLIKNGTTTLWQLQVGAGNFTQSFEAPLRCTAGALASVEIDGTSACKANIAGFTI